MLDSLSFLVSGLIFGSAGGLAPGPTLTLVIAQTLRFDIREGFKIAFAPLLTDAPIILAAIFLLSRMETAPVLGTVALLGAAFLFYLGYASFRSTTPRAKGLDEDPQSIRKGIAANFLNPHPYVFWLTIGGPTLLKAIHVAVLPAVVFIVAHYSCLIGAKVLVAALVDKGRPLLNRFYKPTIRLLGAALVLFGLIFLRDGLRYFGLI